MVLNPLKCRGFISSYLLLHFPKRVNGITCIELNLAAFRSFAASQAFDYLPIKETGKTSPEKSSHGFRSSQVNIRVKEQPETFGANTQITYLQQIDGYQISNESLLEARKLQGKILKLGIRKDDVFHGWLIDLYVWNGDLDSALQTFDDFGCRNLSQWNKLIAGFVGRKSSVQVFKIFSRMLVEKVGVDDSTFASVLRACGGGKISFCSIKQIHAMIVKCGFEATLFVSNPLIDLYTKNGFIDSAKQIFGSMLFRDSVTWVAMISGLSYNEQEAEAVKLYIDMRRYGVMATPYIFSSIISACSKIQFYELGEQLHATVYKWGFSLETFVCNALITLYSRSGKMLTAEYIFTTLLKKDGVSYNSLISGFAQQECSERSFELFEEMLNVGLRPDCVTVASLLAICASTGALHKGRQLHSYTTKAGMCSDTIIEGSLLDLYAKCSDLNTAHKFFLTAHKENVVLWNVLLVAYGLKGDLKESFLLFSQMQSKRLHPNQFTFPSILRTCTLVGDLDLGEQLHSQVIKTGFQPNIYVGSVLIDMYAKLGKLDAAIKILRRLNEEDVVSWTSIISGFSQHNFFIEALGFFTEMYDQGIPLDNIGFASTISACAGIQAFNQGQQFHAQSIVSGYSMDLSINNALINLYARCGKVLDAYLVFDRNTTKDNISWNGLVSGFVQSGHCEEALKVFCQMGQKGLEADMYTYGSVVSAAANTTNIKLGKQVHARIIKTGYNTEVEASNVLITLYAKCGNLEDARKDFLEMPYKNEVTWNAMITGYSQHGRGSDAVELFEEMKKLNLKPNHVTFVGVLSACSHAKLVDEGLRYFNSMSEVHGLLPKAEHYACVVDILGRAGYLGRAREFIETMPIEPDAMVWRTLLSACTVHKNIEMGQLAADHLLLLEPEDSATYVLLSNMYAVNGKWDRRNNARKLMKDRGVKKEPGRSWIEVKNTIHAFYVGDRLHPLADQIYEYLADLNARAAAIGYVQDRYTLRSDLEQEQQDATTFVHSEKLAIVFGLLSLSDSIPLHVMKNLRVCADCHNWIKFVSKVSNRPIVVRDAYRFHHFKDGFCSCKDYW